MSDSYLLHDIMRKVKADGLFDSIRRDLISDLEQKSSYLDLKSQIESLVSSYLSDYKWNSTLRKTDLREKTRRHIETSSLIKETLPNLVNEYMQTCQEQSIQPRISSFISEHLDRMYNTIGGSHIYHPTTSFTQSISVQQEKPVPPPPSPAPVTSKKEPVPSKSNKNPSSTNINKQKIIPKKKPIPLPPPPTTTTTMITTTNSIKEEKKTRILSPIHSPSDLVDISPSPPSMENEQSTNVLTPSPPPPVVRIASPLQTESSKKSKRLSDPNFDDNKKKVKTEETIPQEKPEEIESDTRKLRSSRRPNPKYSNEQYETEDLNLLESVSPSPPTPVATITKSKKSRQLKSSPSFDTPSSPPAPVNEMSPEYGTSVPSPTIEKQSIENIDIQSRSPSPVSVEEKKSTSPRRLRPRRTHEHKTHKHNRHQSDSNDATETKKSRHPSSSTGDSNSLPDNTEDTQKSPVSVPVSKSFIWKPKISK